MAIGPDGQLSPTFMGGSAAGGGLAGLSAAAGMLAIFGALNGAIGAYYSAQSQKGQLESQALGLDYQASLADQNARNAEQDADAILQAGRQEQGLLGLQRAQERGLGRARAAAGGVAGSPEVAAGEEFAYQTDRTLIGSNAVRAANARRLQGVSDRNEAAMLSLSARNLRRTKGTINPTVAGFSSLLSGTGQVASQWANNARY